MTCAIEGLNTEFHLISSNIRLNSHLWLVTFLSDSTVNPVILPIGGIPKG